MPPSEQTDHQFFNHLILPDNDLPDFGSKFVIGVAEAIDRGDVILPQIGGSRKRRWWS